MNIPVQRLDARAKLPTYAHAGDAGADIFSLDECVIKPGERVQIRTGIALAIPLGYVGLIWDKSGLSHRYGLRTLGGVVDSGYRGEVLVGMVHLGTTPHTFRAGDKVAQLLVQRIEAPAMVEVASLEDSTRGTRGFGSTGA